MKLFNTQLTIEDLFIKRDPQTGLIAIIAIHSTHNGPALGGCRFVSYDSVDAAIIDAMRLAEAMTYKSAMAGLPLGGGKAVVISHAKIPDRAKMFEAFGDFVNQFNGRYITASDSGTTENDMKIVAERTRHVTSISKTHQSIDDTAAMTASGVVRAIEAAVKYKFNQNTLDGIHIAVQGVGKVGFLLVKELVERKATVTISDKNQEAMARCAEHFPVKIADEHAITGMECDVFAPCALGGILNKETMPNMKTAIICGAANNQLLEHDDGEILRKKAILYIPDYVANAGGLICASAQAGIISQAESLQKVQHIFDSVMEILQTSADLVLATNIVANKMAEKRFS